VGNREGSESVMAPKAWIVRMRHCVFSFKPMVLVFFFHNWGPYFISHIHILPVLSIHTGEEFTKKEQLFTFSSFPQGEVTLMVIYPSEGHMVLEVITGLETVFFFNKFIIHIKWELCPFMENIL